MSATTRIALATLLSALVLLAPPAAAASSTAWNGLSPGDQQVLRPVETQWNDLAPQTRSRLLRLAQRYRSLPSRMSRAHRDR
ncbi:MAG: DUF3106 domain-containing protein [Betaproteobacteria bacterium]|nr:DUF3106 domain-containing protein [Betaproteobacteria bacterium]